MKTHTQVHRDPWTHATEYKETSKCNKHTGRKDLLLEDISNSAGEVVFLFCFLYPVYQNQIKACFNRDIIKNLSASLFLFLAKDIKVITHSVKQ